MSQRKIQLVAKCMSLLKPNVCHDLSNEWIDVEAGLLRFSLRELHALNTVLTSKRFTLPESDRTAYVFPELAQKGR